MRFATSRRTGWLPAVAVAALLHGTARADTTYHVVDIGTPEGATDSAANGLNDDGLVVGTANGVTAFEYTVAGGFTPLATLPGGTSAAAFGVNDAGVVVGRSNAIGGSTSAVRWSDPATPVPLATTGEDIDTAVAINASGEMAGSGTAIHIPPFSLAFVWAADTTGTNLGAVLQASSTANAINDAGQVVGDYVTQTFFATTAFLWTEADGAHDLGALPDATLTAAYGINGAGAAVGTSGTSSSATVATLWPAAPTPTPLGLLSGGTRSVANAINDAGTAVGLADTADGQHAMVWTEASGMRDLNALSDAADVGITLTTAAAINASGQIAGTGDIGGHSHGFLATPAPEAPAAWPALGALALLRRRRRRA